MLLVSLRAVEDGICVVTMTSLESEQKAKQTGDSHIAHIDVTTIKCVKGRLETCLKHLTLVSTVRTELHGSASDTSP